MAYNNGFPTGYQPYYGYQNYQNYQSQMQSQSQAPQSGGIIWVQGEAGAKSYLVAPNNTIQLWDSESQTIYLKSADASGMPSMKILDYTIRSNSPIVTQNNVIGQVGNIENAATQQDINALQAQIDIIKQQINKIGGKSHESTLQSNAAARTTEQSSAEISTV
jgi:hypothetical protein